MMQLDTLVNAISKLDAWLESMRQKGGYGGPVAHWWQHCLLYSGPAIDWRYEGILAGYHLLYQKTGQAKWRERLGNAARDVISGQMDDGSYRSSQFEMNPGTLGTPHEAAATLGLLIAFPTLQYEEILVTAKRNLDNLVNSLSDNEFEGFNDRPGIRGRVPNKLATFAETLMTYYDLVGDEQYLAYARIALNAVLSYQVENGSVHQYAPNADAGDEKYFPYYNARCVGPLLKGALVFKEERYRCAAEKIVAFLKSVMNADGSWAQIVYPKKEVASFPRWIAGAADILRAFQLVNERVPEISFSRLLNSQLDSGGFPTAEGFTYRSRHRNRYVDPDFRDLLPVVGWNDKTFRFLVEQLPNNVKVGSHLFEGFEKRVLGGNFVETPDVISVVKQNGDQIFYWNKREPWSRCVVEELR